MHRISDNSVIKRCICQKNGYLLLDSGIVDKTIGKSTFLYLLSANWLFPDLPVDGLQAANSGRFGNGFIDDGWANILK
ncbi:MAG: hypothetical protein AB2565_13490 [Candidatus Thiodiazotropha endolucinida]|uniref:hypothetical protein n=1 Tax=Candidatus Thiodiazotropha endolucinida TaxID=1655433 RepID=UPI0012B69BCA|nr:hypothetical protein [Candidatus Thiodiazotropha endolucinida]